MKKEKIISFAVDHSTYEKLEKIAEKQDRSLSYIVRRIIVEEVERNDTNHY